MQLLNRINYLELDEISQDIIAREFVDDFDQGYNPQDYKDVIIEEYEYDPENHEDLSILEDFFAEKVHNEGDVSDEDLKYYLEDPSQLLSFPILIIDGSCKEGRHRLATSLKLNHKIRAYCI